MAPSLTRMLKVLEERGLIVTTRHPSDGRRLLISLSSDGRDFMEDALPDMQRISGHLASALDARRMGELQDC